MCGISAILEFAPARGAPLLEALARMHDAQRHRGPDGEGALVVADDGAARGRTLDEARRAHPRCAIAFRRLAIQDRSPEAAQPLATTDGQRAIAFNGELYNHAELRAALARTGRTPRTGNDAEVALLAWEAWGPAALERMNGMFAFLLVDLARRTLVGARDHLGIKPLFWSLDGTRLLLASEPRAVALARTAPPAPDGRLLSAFLGGIPPLAEDGTFFAGVHPVPPASWFEVAFDAAPALPATRTWWHLPATIDVPPYPEAVERFRTLVTDAVALQRAGDVPVGTLLSGGSDSSFVTRLAALAAPGPVTAFSVVHPDPRVSEVPHQWAVVARGNVRRVQVTLTPERAVDAVDEVVPVIGQPLLGQDIIAQHEVYAAARREGVPVILEGQGPDEMLAGHVGFAAARFRELGRHRRWGHVAREAMAHRRMYGHNPLGVVATALGRRPPLAVPRYPFLPPGAWRGRPDAWAFGGDDFAAALRALVVRTNLPSVLDHQDRASMAHGVESRVPFLDPRIVAFCDALPGDYRLHLGVRKRILRDAARGIVPDTILDRRDKGSIVSSQRYVDLRGAHADALRACARWPGWAGVPGVLADGVARTLEGFLAGTHDDHRVAWRLYTTWRWLRQPPFTA
jgi:asparagine synthase (glutamine-hydrolysing)